MKSAERLLVLVADRHDRPDEHPDRRDEAHEEPCRTGVCHRRNEHAEHDEAACGQAEQRGEGRGRGLDRRARGTDSRLATPAAALMPAADLTQSTASRKSSGRLGSSSTGPQATTRPRLTIATAWHSRSTSSSW